MKFRIETANGINRNTKKFNVDKYKILKFVDKANENGYKDKLYLYLKLTRIILSYFYKRGKPQELSPLYGIRNIQELMQNYYHHPSRNDDLAGAGDNILITDFILFVYHQYRSPEFKDDIWFAFSEHMHIIWNDYRASDLRNISIMRYRAHSFIAESEIKRMISTLVNKNEIYRYIVDIIRKCVNDEYDLNQWIEEKYATRSFGPEHDDYYYPIGYHNWNDGNFKLLREDIDVQRSKKILVNTVLVELKVLIDLHIDMEYQTEINDAIKTISEDQLLGSYILPCTQELLVDTCCFFTKYSSFSYVIKRYDEKADMDIDISVKMAINDLDSSIEEMLYEEDIFLYQYIDRDDSGRTVMRYDMVKYKYYDYYHKSSIDSDDEYDKPPPIIDPNDDDEYEYCPDEFDDCDNDIYVFF